MYEVPQEEEFQSHLEKAKGALEHAKTLDRGDTMKNQLIAIARVQAEVSIAVSLERIADILAER